MTPVKGASANGDDDAAAMMVPRRQGPDTRNLSSDTSTPSSLISHQPSGLGAIGPRESEVSEYKNTSICI